MRLYLSSSRLGNHPEKLQALFGDNKKVAVIMHAGDALSAEVQVRRLAEQIDSLRPLGLEGSNLNLRDYIGRQDDLEHELQQYGGVWIPGGNTFLLRRAMYDSGFDTVVKGLLAADTLVYAGYSAAVVVLAPTLRYFELVDDPAAVQAVYKEEPMWEGLNILKYSVVPHYRSDHDESAAMEEVVRCLAEKDMPYKTLQDGQAIIVRDGVEEVVE